MPEPRTTTVECDIPIDDTPPRVAIVGGGISGLAAAHRLLERVPAAAVSVLEADPRPGGVLRTIELDGFRIEASADSFLTSLPWAMDLCRRLGIEDRLLPTEPAHRRAFVVHKGQLRPIPDGLMIMAPTRIWPLITTPILSPWGKLRMAAEWLIPPGNGRDESLASFARRRFGREGFARLIQPLVGGMYTGDPERLGVRATMPRFLEMEQSHGSLIRALRRSAGRTPGGATPGSGARYGLFVGLRGGMVELVDALVHRLPADTIRCGARVAALGRAEGGGWALQVEGSGAMVADAVVLATPVRDAAALLAGVDPELSERLGSIPTTSSAIASLGYLREQIRHPLDGFGFVVPRVEQRPILSGSFSSVKFAGRSPAGHSLIRVFVGGSNRPDLLDESDASLFEIAHRELANLLGIRGEPVLRHLSRWREAMPQYQVGHLDLVASIESRVAALPGLVLAGNAYHGIGVPQCIHSGERAAERIAASWEARAAARHVAPGRPAPRHP